jgi:hypothetical protein
VATRRGLPENVGLIKLACCFGLLGASEAGLGERGHLARAVVKEAGRRAVSRGRGCEEQRHGCVAVGWAGPQQQSGLIDRFGVPGLGLADECVAVCAVAGQELLLAWG